MPHKSRNPLKRLASSIIRMQERHKERHRPTGFGFVFADRVGYLDLAQWQGVTASASVLLRPEVLQVFEKEAPDNVQQRYAMVFRGERSIAGIAAQVVSIRGDRFSRDREMARADRTRPMLRRALSPAARAAQAQIRERLLVAGNLLAWGFHGIAFAPGEDPEAVWPGIAEALYRLRRAERLTGQTNLVLLKDITPKETGLEALKRFGYRPLETEPNMVLELNPSWRNYEDYLSALDAKYRRNAKATAQKLAGAGCKLEQLTDLAPDSQRLHELYLAVQGNSSMRLVTLQPGFLPALAGALGPDFRCTVARRGGEILGFVTSIRDGGTSIAYYLGFDRAAAAEGAPLYLRLLHTTISDAIHWGCRRVSLGRTALEPKAAMGAKPEAMAVWLRHRVPAMNWLLQSMLRAVPHEEAPERNPFKVSA